MKIVYKCPYCKKEFEVDELPEMEEFNEQGDWEYLCTKCRRPLVWGIK